MLSTISGILVSDPIMGNPLPSFENRFTPWLGCSEPLFSTPHPTPQSPKPGLSFGSEEPNPGNSNSGSDKTIMDDRRKRRMISNRESARRSRMRKQKHLENLRNQVTRLRVENRELSNRLRFVLHHCYGVKTENQQLRSEQSALCQRLNNIQQIFLFRQLQQFTWSCNNNINNHNTTNHNDNNNNNNNNLIASKDHFAFPPSLIAS